MRCSSSIKRDGTCRTGSSCRENHNHPAAAQMPRTEPCRARLAVAARQLAVKPYLQILQRHPRSLLSRMEQTRRYALEDHVHRSARLGASAERLGITTTTFKSCSILYTPFFQLFGC